MGGIWAKIKSLFNKPHKIVIVGADDVGKTTILYKLKLGDIVKTVPTIGLNVQTLQYNGLTLICWELGFRQNMNPLFKYYFVDCSAIIFVVDASCNDDRYEQQIKLFNTVLNYEGVKGMKLPFLILANKFDLATRTKEAITTDFGLNKLELSWTVQQCIAIKQQADELLLGLQWLSIQLRE